jgi:NAD dependent epimerase/dehydratase family enzyme
MGDGRQWMPWIHLADEVRALQFLIEDERAAGAFNCAGRRPSATPTSDAAIGDVLHRPSFMPAPAFALKAALGEMSTIRPRGQRCVPDEAVGSRLRLRACRAPAGRFCGLLRPV